ncbi:nuclear protein MDM1 isoform X1 [Arapaima gigas]
MPVCFKGITEYQKKFKSKSVQSRSTALQLGMRQAGLRSDQLGITKEPQFLSKKRVPFYRPQVSRSLQWEEPEDPQGDQQGSEDQRPSCPSAETPEERPGSSEKLQNPLTLRSLKNPDISSTNLKLDALPDATPAEREEPKQLLSPLAPTAKFAPAQNGVQHVLRRKTGLKNTNLRGGLYCSEYQRQFLWKTPVARSPLLAAEQVLLPFVVLSCKMICRKKRVIPPYKTDSMVLESEYRRNFRGSPPAQGPRLRQDLEDREGALFHSENLSPEKDAKVASLLSTVVFLTLLKVKTEYSSNFCSPLQYRYKDDSVLSHIWFDATADVFGFQVRELRQKAEAYRKRAWGTHFSRDHLSQILSEYNRLWEASTMSSEEHRSHTLHPLDLESERNSVVDGIEPRLHDAATIPVQRRLAWEDADKGDGPESMFKTRREQQDEEQHSGKQEEEKEVVDKQESTDNEYHPSPMSSPDTLREEGRVPTPKLKTIAVVPRTHHDLTTPATGGAILVSPPKLKDFQGNFRRSEPPLGRPLKRLSLTSIHQESGRANTNMVQISSAAGLSTLDPIPLREDVLETDSQPEVLPAPCHDRSSQKLNGGAPSHPSVTAPAVRIQGMLRDPEFQHNDDRMSQISSLSAASCSIASQVLARAQKRKEDFWGKS